MTILSWVLWGCGFAVIAAISAGGVEAILPGGSLNPYHSNNVTKNQAPLRVAAYLGAVALAGGCVSLAFWVNGQW